MKTANINKFIYSVVSVQTSQTMLKCPFISLEPARVGNAAGVPESGSSLTAEFSVHSEFTDLTPHFGSKAGTSFQSTQQLLKHNITVTSFITYPTKHIYFSACADD